VVEGAFLVVECQICPLDSMTASQNALLVCTLVIYIAQAYNQLVTSIHDEEKRCIRGDIMKTMQLGEFASDLGLCPNALAFETTPGEWRSIAMKALKSTDPRCFGPSVPLFYAVAQQAQRTAADLAQWAVLCLPRAGS
jgi:hypothetical protein